MKNFILLAALTLSVEAYANADYRAGDEDVPTKARTQTARQCFSEAVSSGCRHPREGREEFRACVRDQMGSFTSGCQTFMSRLYGKGN
jgi:hypothetical protein